MNQTEKHVFWKNYQEWLWTFLQWGFLFIFFLFCFGPALWIQSAVLAGLILFSVIFLFSSQVKKKFKGAALKGCDPWRLQSLRSAGGLRSAAVIVHPHPTPFVLGYDFYKNKKLILSSSFIEHFKKGGMEPQLKGMALLFEKGFFQRFTWMSYLFFLVFLPFQPLMILFQRFSSIRYAVESVPAFLCFCMSLPFQYWIHKQYYLADQNIQSLFKTKKQCSEWMWEIHTFWTAASERPLLFLSPLFFINPLTHRPFYFNIHPRTERRIQKLTGSFPI